MSHQATPQSQDPTHTAWLDKVRPLAERTISNLWRPQYSACLLWTSPRGLDRKGRLTSGVEKKESRQRAFDDARRRVLAALTKGDHDAAKSWIESSEFAHAMRVAFSSEETVARFAEFLAAGDNAWCNGDAGECVLWICSWRE